jgi:polysaccharide deacetylase 2 family uncharacterized protein YibQ
MPKKKKPVDGAQEGTEVAIVILNFEATAQERAALEDLAESLAPAFLAKVKATGDAEVIVRNEHHG